MSVQQTANERVDFFTILREKLPSTLFSMIIILFLVWGWSQREEYWYVAEEGLGYVFGITGLTLMALLLLYPLRKRWQIIRELLPIKYWFQMHMIFGVLGPVFILFHANFNHGSINSTVALYSMLLVAGSGLVGRFVYAQIHRGVYGEAIRYKDLVSNLESNHVFETFVKDSTVQQLKTSLDSEQVGMVKIIGTWSQLRGMKRSINEDARVALNTLLTMAKLRFFSRLFSWWHVFHLPIFFMMIITAAVHVVVVHMY